MQLSSMWDEPEVDLIATHKALVEIEGAIDRATEKHNAFLREPGLPLLSSMNSSSPEE